MNLSLSRRRFLSLAAGSVAAASTTGPWSTHRNRFAYGSVGSSMQAGAAKVSIDPPSFPVFVNGGFRARTVEKIVDPLFARCLVLDDGTTQIAIGTVDNCVVPRELFDRAKAIAARSIGIPEENIFFSATHTHSAPSVAACLGTPCQNDYAEWLPERIAKAIESAQERLQPARVGWAKDEDPENVFCRRFLMKPGTAKTCRFTGSTNDRAQMNPGHQNPNAIERTGPRDTEVSILSVQTASGKPLALLGNYSTHYAGSPALSSDYFGVFCEKIGRFLDADDDFVGLMTNGTSGDANCIDFTSPRRKFNYHSVGEDVARAAMRAQEKIAKHREVSLEAVQSLLTLKVRVPEAEEVEEAKAYLRENVPEGLPKTMEQVYANETVVLSEMPPTRELKIQSLRIGELGIVGLPNEVYGSTGLAIKAHSPLPSTFSISMANGWFGYIPPADQFPLGGYTTWRARSSCLEVEAESKIRSESLTQLAELAAARQES
jgi:hypothetical protein